MTAYVDLEIGLHRRNKDYYEVEVRINRPDNDADIRPPQQDGPQLVQLDLQRLLSLETNEIAYGQELSQSLFKDGRVHQAFAEALSVAQSHDQALRFRLLIGPSALELQSLHWEKLRDPDRNTALATNEQILFSRYLSSFDWREVCFRSQTELRALVVIANPAVPADHQFLSPLNVERELAQAKKGLGTIPVTELASGGQATLNNLCNYLRDGFDILYLVCHGALIKGEPYLWLENDPGGIPRSGMELVEQLRNLPQRPRLVVLASCQSAGDGAGGTRGAGGALAGLGPRLAEAGIPAVLAMQGDVMVETLSRFMPIFFSELQRDGQIDRAMAAARNAVQDRLDWWMPVLFMRLKSGRLWYAPGFEQEKSLKTWPAVLQQIELGKCTPVLGPGLNEAILGCPREIARRWAEAWHFPMAPHQRDDLPQVAQYLSINLTAVFPRDQLEIHLRSELARRYYGGALPEDLQEAPLTTVLSEVGAKFRADNPSEPHAVLASLPLSIYITTTPDNLLTEALRAAGKDPQVEICPWNDDLARLPSVFDKKRKPPYKPTKKQPLVYHLFGRFKDPDSDEPDSLVLTEDDYFDYLIGVTRNRELIPKEILGALANSALLFLGFQIDDWDFRVLFRSLMSQEGGRKLCLYPHVAVQIDPEAGRLMDPKRARQYLEEYFGNAKIGIYWGRPDDFLRELQKRRGGGAP